MNRSLTKCELEVAIMAARGMNATQITKKRGCHIETTRRHISNIYDKLEIFIDGDLPCRVQLLRKMLKGSSVMQPTFAELEKLASLYRELLALNET